MDWFRGSKHGEAKRLLALLADVTQRDRAARELIRLGDDAVTALMEALHTKDERLVPIYQQVLARIPSATPVLSKSLSTAHPIVRARVATVLALSKDRSAAAALLDAVEGEYFTVRAQAALALARIGIRDAIPPLTHALRDPENEVRIAACLALGLYRDPSIFDDIAAVLLDDAVLEVRQAAARALGNTEHPAALPYLMEALHDSFWWYEREAAAGDLLLAIKKIGKPAVEPLIEALQDKEGTVRKFAALLLGRLHDPHALEPLGMAQYDLHHEVGKIAAQALAQFGVPAVGMLVEALRHPEMWIRIHAVEALSSVRDGRVIPVLLDMLQDPEREVRKQVIRRLGELHDTRALPALQNIAADRADREIHLLAKQALATLTKA